jgi:hypothetical protein
VIYVDDRTEEQFQTHTQLVGGHDRFMSGWGGARGGKSYAAWACRPEDFDRVWLWVNRRKDLKNVRVEEGSFKVRGAGHCHTYVVDEGHPALAAR